MRLGVGGTALGWAAFGDKNPEVTTALLKAGADIEAHSVDGRTALSWAAEYNNPDVVMVLLNAGSDAKMRDKFGFTAFDYAKRNGTLKGTDALKKLEEASK